MTTKHAVDIYKSINECPDRTEITVCGIRYNTHSAPYGNLVRINDTVDVCIYGMDDVTCDECVLLLFEKSARMKEGSERCKCGATCSYAKGIDSKCDGKVTSLTSNDFHLCEYHQGLFE